MAIQPISSSMVKSNRNLTTFGANYEKAPSNYVPERQSSLKKVPVLVLMAMSPLVSAPAPTYANSAEKVQYVDNIEQIDQSPRHKFFPREVIRDGFHVFDVLKISTDDDDTDAEMVLFRYRAISEGGYEKVMDAQLRAYCVDKERDGSHIVALREVTNHGETIGKYKLVRVPAKFADYLNKFVFSDQNSRQAKNDWTILASTKEGFVQDFGMSSVKNAPMINEAATRIVYEDGTEKIISKTAPESSDFVKASQVDNTYRPNIIGSKKLPYLDSYYKLNLISTDDDDSNFEEIECIYNSVGSIYRRGIIKNACYSKDDEGNIKAYVNGIPLSITDLDDYNVNRSKGSVFRITAPGKLLYNELSKLLSSPANNTGVTMFPGFKHYSPQQALNDSREYQAEHNLD